MISLSLIFPATYKCVVPRMCVKALVRTYFFELCLWNQRSTDDKCRLALHDSQSFGSIFSPHIICTFLFEFRENQCLPLMSNILPKDATIFVVSAQWSRQKRTKELVLQSLKESGNERKKKEISFVIEISKSDDEDEDDTMILVSHFCQVKFEISSQMISRRRL